MYSFVSHKRCSVLHPNNIRDVPATDDPGRSEILLDFPILAEAIEEMMLSRHRPASGDDRWSEDAKNFLSCSLSGSLKNLMKVRYLSRRNKRCEY